MSDPVTMPRSAMEALLEDAAERGARKALASVGLHDEEAAGDIRGLRELFGAYRTIRKGALRKAGEMIAVAIIGGLLLLAWSRFKS